MIHLQKGPEPQILANNSASWTRVLIQKQQAGVEPTDTEKNRYNHPDIKAALIAETSGKCAYCESKFEHLTYGDIEHITPKQQGHHLRFVWSNLTIACDRCNTNKGTNPAIIDPYVPDPEQKFIIFGAYMMPIPSMADAVVTEAALKLNRGALIERRQERVRALSSIVASALLQPDDAAKQAILGDLETTETADGAEFAAISRAFVAYMKGTGWI